MSWKIPASHRRAVAEVAAPRIGGLGPRLSAVAAAVPNGSVVADIGADHGHLSKGLLASGVATFVYAVDASELALAGAQETLASEISEGRAEALLGDGFRVLPTGKIQCAVLAGIGSKTALDIVRQGLAEGKRPRRIVFQASGGEHDVRTAMLELGYGIAHESLVAEGRRLFMVQCFDDGQGASELADLVDVYVGPRLRHAVGPVMDAWLGVQADWLAEVIAQTNDPDEERPWRDRLASIETLQCAREGELPNLHET